MLPVVAGALHERRGSYPGDLAEEGKRAGRESVQVVELEPLPPLASSPAFLLSSATTLLSTERTMSERTSPRLEAIDALRGFALIGIAIVNTPWIGSEISLGAMLVEDSLREALPWWDVAAAAAIEWLGEGKFYPQFSMLFGFGAGVMMTRGLGPQARRLVVLLAFGLLHSLFGWWGDILLNYAVLGLLLIPLDALSRLASRPASVLFGLALVLGVAASVVSFLFDEWLFPDPVADAGTVAYRAENVRLYATGSFWEISLHRWDEAVMGFFLQWNWAYRLNTLAMGVLGLALERSGLLVALATDRKRLGRYVLVLVPLGLGLALVPWLYIPGGDVLALGWASLVLWLVTGARGDGLRRMLAPLGRMALSGYLGQTLVLTLTFYSYGLALYGQLGPAAMLALGAGTWLVEILLARVWLARFELGPFEWLWRSVTYLRPMPLERAPRTP